MDGCRGEKDVAYRAGSWAKTCAEIYIIILLNRFTQANNYFTRTHNEKKLTGGTGSCGNG